MEVNFFGAQNVCREVIPLMRERRTGRIINISSVAGFSASPCFSAYNCSKWALEAFSECLRSELKFYGIEVFLIEPGTYKTKIFYDNARYAQNFDNPQSPYYRISRHLKMRVLHYVNNCRKDPEAIPLLIERLIKGKNLSLRHIPDIEGRLLYWARKFLPFRVYSWLCQQALFIDLSWDNKLQRNSHSLF